MIITVPEYCSQCHCAAFEARDVNAARVRFPGNAANIMLCIRANEVHPRGNLEVGAGLDGFDVRMIPLQIHDT